MNYTKQEIQEMVRMYFDVFTQASRVTKAFLDLLKSILDKANIVDITPIQSVVLYNIGEGRISVGDITTRGYYIGSNVSYNLKKMIEMNYITSEESENDKRITQIRLTEKGLDLYKIIDEKISEKPIDQNNCSNLIKRIKEMEEKLIKMNS
jgi:DNA-binding MarR family transcriptional regulator